MTARPKLRLSLVAKLSWQGLKATLPALLLLAVLEWLSVIVLDVWVVGDPSALTGWPGLGRLLLSMTLQSLIMMLPALMVIALLLNAIGERRLGLAEVVGRAVRAVPTAIAITAVLLLVTLAGAVPGYFGDGGGWTPWISYRLGEVAVTAIAVFIGYATTDAIARRVGLWQAVAGSLALTRGYRWILFVIGFVSHLLVNEISVWTGGSVDVWLTAWEMTDLGSRPVMSAVWALGGLVVGPLGVALYVLLRRLHDAAAPDGVAAMFD